MSKLEKASYTAVIVVSALSAYTLLDSKIRHVVPGRARQTASTMAGKRLDVAGLQWSGSRLNILIAMTTQCHYCMESLPFYRRLSQAVASQGRGVSLRAASSEPIETVRSFLAGHDVPVSQVLTTSFKSIGVTGTPTMFLVDPSGTVKRAYIGKLSEKQEGEILAFVRLGKL